MPIPILILIVSNTMILIPWFSLASKSIRKRNDAKTSTSAAPAASPAPAARSASTPSGATGASAHQARHIFVVYFAYFSLFCYIKKQHTFILVLKPDGTAGIFFLPPYAAAMIRTVRRVGPGWDL